MARYGFAISGLFPCSDIFAGNLNCVSTSASYNIKMISERWQVQAPFCGVISFKKDGYIVLAIEREGNAIE